MKTKRRKPGKDLRPMSIRMTPAEYDQIKANARAAGLSMTAFIKAVCLNAKLEFGVKQTGGSDD